MVALVVNPYSHVLGESSNLQAEARSRTGAGSSGQSFVRNFVVGIGRGRVVGVKASPMDEKNRWWSQFIKCSFKGKRKNSRQTRVRAFPPIGTSNMFELASQKIVVSWSWYP
jgi:hypothetical protein